MTIRRSTPWLVLAFAACCAVATLLADTATKVPTGDGAVSDWGRSAGCASSDFDCLDDPVGSPDDDTTYCVQTAAGGSANELFTYADFSITAGSTITNVGIFMRAMQTGSGGTIRGRIRTGAATDTNSATPNTPGASYADDATFVYTTNPTTTLAWTVDEVNGVDVDSSLEQIGGRIASTVSGEVRVTQLYGFVTYTPPAGGGRRPGDLLTNGVGLTLVWLGAPIYGTTRVQVRRVL